MNHINLGMAAEGAFSVLREWLSRGCVINMRRKEGHRRRSVQ